MRSPGLSRLYRRVIIKHFGSTRNFVIWTGAVILTIYVIDSYILTRDRLQSLVVGEKDQELPLAGAGAVDKINKAAGAQPGNVAVGKRPQGDEGVAGKAPPAVHNDIKDKAQLPDPPKEKPPEKPAAAEDRSCGLKEACPNGKYAYFVRSGYGRDVSPTICFNGQYAMTPEKKNGQRGINMVVVNEKTAAIEDVRTFDTYQEDSVMVRYLKLGVPDNRLILAATQDEASYHIGPEGKQGLHQVGSSLIDKLGFRDNLVIVGQRGLSHGSAIEKYSARDSTKDFADQVEVSGCLPMPMGKLGPVEGGAKGGESAAPLAGAVKLGEELPNCGVKEDCGADAVPVHLYSGQENKEGPKICVSGKYVLAKGLNDGGRGFNIVIVDPKSKDVIRVGHFDTYAEDSSNLEIFLEMMNDKEIIVAVTHDDASKNLNLHAQKILESLGASWINKLGFRDAWGMVGQRGIDGASAHEKIEFVSPGGQWPRSIDRKVCVPTELKGSKIKPDPLANKNENRRNFCSKFDGYGEFCETEHVDEPLVPAPLTDKAMENHNIFQVPIIVIPGLNHNAVRMQLETLLMNPGIKPGMVTVMYDEKFDEPAALADLFSFKSAKLASSTKYVYQMEKALEKVWEIFPKADAVIVLEEEVIPSQDMLYFLAQCLAPVQSDNTLAGISCWNDNGYTGLSTNPELAYRVTTMPGLGFLLKHSFYTAVMHGKMEQCCQRRSWDGWFSDHVEVEMVIPDVSRVYRRPYEGLSEQADFLKELFNRPRVTNMDASSKLTNPDSLTRAQYELTLEQLFSTLTPLDTANVEDCLLGKGLGFYVPETQGKTFGIFFEQETVDDYRILLRLCKCFKLFSATGHKPRGLHRGLLRFTFKGNNMVFVGTASPYNKFIPADYKTVKVSQLPS